ncbi:MAG: hypothetical protein JWL66_2197 [Sphingomonadales bacterium]|nr:hypothetical protein [Sphingomonadales bacterium]
MNGYVKPRLRKDINGLRAIAVSGVLLYHFNISGFIGGFGGVDVFFVISGYLMTLIVLRGLSQNTYTLRGFYLARLRRIAPALMTMIAVCVVCGAMIVDPISYKQMGYSGLTSLLFISNFYYYLQSGYFTEAAESMWFLHTWSLSVEWQFYIIYPIVLAIIGRFPSRYLLLIFVGFTVVGFSLLAFLPMVGGGNMSSLLFYMFPARAPEMTLGGIVYLLGTPRSNTTARYAEVIGILAILLSFFIFDLSTIWPGFAALLPVLGTAAVIYSDRGEQSLLSNRMVQRIGEWSYSIYLWHWPVRVSLRYFDLDGTAIRWSAIGLSIALGMLSFYFVEKRFSASRSGTGSNWLLKLSSVGYTLVAVACAGVICSQGWPERSSRSTRSLLADTVAAKSEWQFPANCDGRLCRFGSGQPSSVLVLGDSHAQMWLPGFLNSAKKYNQTLDFFTLAGCPSVPRVAKRSNIACGELNSQIEHLAFQGRYKKVIIINAWNDYFGDFRKTTMLCVTGVRGCESFDAVTGKQAAQLLLTTFVSALVAHGLKVSIVPDAPSPPFDVPNTIAKIAFRENTGSLGFDRYPEQKMRPNDSFNISQIMVQSGINSVDIFNPSAVLCADSLCKMTGSSGHSLYRDNNHLRPAIARELGDFDSLFDGPNGTSRGQ